jgi:hypothetical protein
MKKHGLFFMIFCLISLMGCTQTQDQTQNQMNNKPQAVNRMAEQISRQKEVQQSFSEGRLQVMRQNEDAKRSILANTMKEQKLILKDKKLSDELLRFNIEASERISKTPELRSEMAQTMLPLLKEPVIAQEMEKMIKMAVAKEIQKLKQQQLKQAAKQRPIQIQQTPAKPQTQIQRNQDTTKISRQEPSQEQEQQP